MKSENDKLSRYGAPKPETPDRDRLPLLESYTCGKVRHDLTEPPYRGSPGSTRPSGEQEDEHELHKEAAFSRAALAASAMMAQSIFHCDWPK